MKSHPEAMAAALQTHNAALRKAKWQHCGHVAEQEGDAFQIVFHDAMDAVAFCLQAQQALMKADWAPELLAATGPGEDGAAARGGAHARAGSRSRLLNLLGAVGRRGASAASGGAGGPSVSRRHLGGWSDYLGQQQGAASGGVGGGGGGGAGGGGAAAAARFKSAGSWRAFASLRQPSGGGSSAGGGGGGTSGGGAGGTSGGGGGGAAAVASVDSTGAGGGNDAEAHADVEAAAAIEAMRGGQEAAAAALLHSRSGTATPLHSGSYDGVAPLDGSGGGGAIGGGAASGGNSFTAGAGGFSLPARTASGACLGAGANAAAAVPFTGAARPPRRASADGGYAPFSSGAQRGGGGGGAPLPPPSPSAESLAAAAEAAAALDAGAAGARGVSSTSLFLARGGASVGSAGAPAGACGPAAALLGPAADSARLFRGLRVRMGVATGDVAAGQDIKSTEVWQLAKAVSDAGAGGQVVMCGLTFERVKDRLHVRVREGERGLEG